MIRYLSLILALAVCLGASVAGAAESHPITSLPYVEDFESYTQGALGVDDAGNPWSTNEPSGSALVQSTNVLGEDIDYDGTDGTQSLEANMCDLTLTLDIDSPDTTNVWFQVYAKATPYTGSTPTVPTDDVAAFFVDENGDVNAMNDASWDTFDTNLDANDYHCFAVQLNFNTSPGTWNLFISQDDTYGTALQRLNTSGALQFGSTCVKTELTEFSVAGIALLDAIAIQEDSKFQSKDNLIVKALDLDAGEQTQLGLFAHDYNSANDNLGENSELGDDLRNWLDVDDYLTVFDSQAREYQRDTQSPDYWDDSGAGGTTPANMHITPGTAVWIEKDSSGPFVAFMDYAALATSSDKTVNGTSLAGGMNFLAWDKPGISQQLGNSSYNAAGFSAIAGQRDYLYHLGGSGSGKAPGGVTRLWWNDDENENVWYDGRYPAQQTLSPGDTFWYYRGSDTDPDSWDIDNAQ